ncbi:MAG: hypothetical protein NT036_00235 [Candidatus Omnitrophica bacterium]|nr:hypothetical protein [Candidatus Omnitrophota bacterium]
MRKMIIALILVSLLVVIAYKAHSYDVRQTRQELEGRQLENKKSWTKILKDMPADQIKEILGAPERILEGVTTVWFYQKGGSVTFSDGKVIKTIKPFSWDY